MLKFLKNIVPFAAAAGCLLLAGGCSRTMYPQGQHRRDLQPPTDAVLCYGGSHHRTPFLWDKERLAPYVTYVDKEGTEHWLFDGFIFLEFQDTNRPDAELYAFETGHLRDTGESAGKAAMAGADRLLFHGRQRGRGPRRGREGGRRAVGQSPAEAQGHHGTP